MDIQVFKGKVRLSSIYLSVDTPDVKIVDVDAHSKYYEVTSWSDSENDVQKDTFYLIPVERSLRLDDNTDERTEIVFSHNKDEQWEVMSDDGARYGFRIVFMRRVPDRMSEVLWRDTED